MENKSNIYIVSIIAIVAIVGLFSMFMPKGNMAYETGQQIMIADDEGNLAGEAFRPLNNCVTLCEDFIVGYKNNYTLINRSAPVFKTRQELYGENYSFTNCRYLYGSENISNSSSSILLNYSLILNNTSYNGTNGTYSFDNFVGYTDICDGGSEYGKLIRYVCTSDNDDYYVESYNCTYGCDPFGMPYSYEGVCKQIPIYETRCREDCNNIKIAKRSSTR